MSMTGVVTAPRQLALRIRDSSAGWLGIDIGSSTIKIAQVGRSRSGWSLRLAHIIPSPGGRVIDRAAISGGILDDWLDGQVCGLFRRRSSDAACVLSMAVMGMHTLEFPPGSPHETAQMISMELDAAGEPTPREFDSFECRGLTATEAGLTPRTVLSLPNSIGEVIADSLQRHKLQCQTIDSLPCAHARAVSLLEPHCGDATSAVLDWGAAAPTFTLVRNGSPVYCRPLRDCGLKTVLSRAAAPHGLSESELQELLSAHARVEGAKASGISRTLSVLREISTAAARSLCEELARTLTYLRRQAASLTPDTIWLMGGGALLPDIAPQLTTLLDRPVRLWQLGASSASGPTNSEPIQAIFAPAIAASSLGVRP
jgi:Tfp pilus assembly PilM family ATPase